MHIEAASATAVQQHLAQLKTLLVSTVNSGASIGWLPPMPEAAAEEYWHSRIAAISEGRCVLLLAWEGMVLVGTAQLSLEQRENGLHRAEVQKVMVRADYRRRGIGEQLMAALEKCALEQRRSLLFLDTRFGDAAEALYQKMGYVEAGKIADYVRNPDGSLHATVVYYKILS